MWLVHEQNPKLLFDIYLMAVRTNKKLLTK